MKILLVDDREDELYMSETLLKSGCHEVVCARNGIEALDRLREDRIDLIISDILMPKMDGYRLCRECKKDDRFKKLPFIFLSSSYLEKKDENFALSLGAERFIRRPVGPEEFIGIIEDVIKKQRDGVVRETEQWTVDELTYLTEYNERLLNKLEQKVQALENEITERRRSEEAIITAKNRIAADLDAMEKLHKIGLVYLSGGGLQEILEKVLDAAISITGADMGNIQLLDPHTAELKITVHRGFSKEWLDFWAGVSEGHGTWGTALRSRERIIVEDVAESPIFRGTPELEVQLKEGVRAVQSTPLLSRSGRLLGMVSTHYKSPCRPEEQGLLLLDTLAGETALIIETFAKEEGLRLFKALIDHSNDPVEVLDPETGKFLIVNEKAYTTLGYSREEILSMKVFDIDPLLEPSDFTKVMEELNRTGAMIWQGIHKRKDGTTFPVEVSLKIVVLDRSYLVAITRDITERKKAEEALRDSEEKFRTMALAAHDAIIMMGNEGEILFWNDAAEKIFGYSRPEVLGKNLHMFLVPPRYHDAHKKGFERFRMTGEGAAVGKILELAAIRKDGEEFPIELSVSAVMLKGRWHAIGVLRDITGRKKAEEEQERLQEQLRQSHKLEGIGQLAGGIAHDFNNILSAIIGFGGLAHLKLPADSPIQYYITEVLAAGNRGASLTQQILAFSRKQVLDIKTVDLNDVVAGIDKMLRRLMREDIRIKFILSDAPLTILADASQIDQILLNLATNARDAMPEGGDLIISTSMTDIAGDFISAHCYGTPGIYALLTVSDTGTGMDKATENRIFEPFFTTKESGKGTGLGLAVVYGIVKQHNGFIDVDSGPGRGTVFSVYLPLISGESGKIQADRAVPVQGGTETILLADDDENIKEYISEMLEHFGYKVISAENGDDAVDKFMKNRDAINLLVLDIIMPFKGGKEAYDEIFKISPDIKALFMSGHTGDVIAKKRIAEDGLDFIAKPFRPEDFLGRVREILDRK
ncbi:MAG: PAS domain S-box protein [Nitrospirae bacterium]|nr:MAG: PAS domain S-box protein [Nitrospirota bacterium]